MTTIDVLITKDIEEEFLSLRSQLPTKGFVLRDFQTASSDIVLDRLAQRTQRGGVDAIILVAGSSPLCPIAQQAIATLKPLDRFLGVEEQLRSGRTPFLQSFVGLVDDIFVFVIPGMPSVVEQLIHILKRFPQKETHLPYQKATPLQTDKTLDDFDDGQPDLIDYKPNIQIKQNSSPSPTLSHTAPDWQSTLATIGGKILPDVWMDVPSLFSSIPPVMNLFSSAGNQKTVVFPSGQKYLLLGYPDLLRRNSKVLLIGESLPFGEVIPLHRYSRKTGVLCHEGCGWLPSPATDIKRLSVSQTGKACPITGTPFAIAAGKIYVHSENKIYCWNGQDNVVIGTVKQALTSLILEWSQR